MTEFRLPDLGEGLDEAEIVSWGVAVGDEVMPGQTLVSVETDKAVVDIPAPERGRVAALHGAPGERVKVGAVLVEFADGARADAGALVGRLPTHEDATPATAPAIAATPTRPAPQPRVKAMPAVRALATRLGVELAKVRPSGPAGEITVSDVEHAARETTGAGAITGEKLHGVRRAMAANMTRAREAVVPATAMDQADVESWWNTQADTMTRLVRAVVVGCRASPALNCWYDDHAQSRQLHERVDLGIAMDTADGLFVPVLRDAGGHDARSLRVEIERLKDAVLSRRVVPEELRGQTITLSNFGSIGGRFAALVVVPPQVAILGVGRIGPGLVATDTGSAVRSVLPLSLTFDHRVVNGGEAARFLAAVIGDLERPD
jgi:2-oxoisovalerate dehydrogenase E2 component (dihydrolipoyl transacylase)